MFYKQIEKIIKSKYDIIFKILNKTITRDINNIIIKYIDI